MTVKDQWRASILPRIEIAKQALRECDISDLAAHSGCDCCDEGLRLQLFGDSLCVTVPEFDVLSSKGTVCREEAQLLILDYLSFSRNLSPSAAGSQDWVGFQELPNGAFYAKAFRTYTSDLIMGRLDGDTARFQRACRHLNGQAFSLGDAAFAFQALPRIRLAAVWWAGDEEFSAHANILFDPSSAHALPIDGMATLGRLFSRKFLAAVDHTDFASRRTIGDLQPSRSHHV